MIDDLKTYREHLAAIQAERELMARVERRATALSWWLRAHPCATSDDWIRLQTDPDYADAYEGWEMLVGLGGIANAIEFVTCNYWVGTPDGVA